MAKRTSSQPFPYILECERDLPENDQTTFWLKPRKTKDTAKALERVSKARDIRPGGQELYKGKAWIAGEQENFIDMVDHIENYWFSDDFPQFSKEAMNIENANVAILREVFYDLRDEERLELVDACQRHFELESSDRKKLNSPSSTSSGKAGSQKEDGSTTVPSVKTGG